MAETVTLNRDECLEIDDKMRHLRAEFYRVQDELAVAARQIADLRLMISVGLPIAEKSAHPHDIETCKTIRRYAEERDIPLVGPLPQAAPERRVFVPRLVAFNPDIVR